MQCACAIQSSVVSAAILNFSTLSHKCHDFREKLLNIKCVCFDFLHNFCLKDFSFVRRTGRDITINVNTSLCKVSKIPVRF